MTLLAKRSIIKEDKSNIITLGAIAKEEKLKDPSVVNATIGMLYGEDGKLFAFKSVDDVLSKLSVDEKYSYASTPGSPIFHEAIKKWIYRGYYSSMKDNTRVMATPGGTGALSNTFSNYLNEDECALLPSYMWGNYKQCLYENHQGYETYNLFNNQGGFDLDNLKEKMYLMKERQKRVLFVINDPCQNPTGYTMTSDEWDKVIDLMNEVSKDGTPVILIHDMAYIDYAKEGFDFTRDNISKYQRLNNNCLVVMAFSGSKTLALYGIRIGAQVAYSNNLEALDDFSRANKFSGRSKWSNASNLGMNIIVKCFMDDDYKKSFEDELKLASNTLVERAIIFLDECKKINLETLPFKCGFFVTIPTKNSEKVYAKLVEKKVHVIPMGDMIRVTISAISKAECKMLPSLIKEAILASN